MAPIVSRGRSSVGLSNSDEQKRMRWCVNCHRAAVMTLRAINVSMG